MLKDCVHMPSRNPIFTSTYDKLVPDILVVTYVLIILFLDFHWYCWSICSFSPQKKIHPDVESVATSTSWILLEILENLGCSFMIGRSKSTLTIYLPLPSDLSMKRQL